MKTCRLSLFTLGSLALATFASAAPAASESPVYISSAVEFRAGGTTYFAPQGVGSMVAQGVLVDVSPFAIDAADTFWTDNLFDNRPHYIEITSGPYAGLTSFIVHTDGANSRLTLEEDLSLELEGNESFCIRRAFTLGDLFGYENEAGLTAGSAPCRAAMPTTMKLPLRAPLPLTSQHVI